MQGSLKRLSALRKVQEDAESAVLGRLRAHLKLVESVQLNESLRIRSLGLAVHQQMCEGDRADAWASEVELALAPARGRRITVLVETACREAQNAQAAWMETRRRRMEAETLHAAAERKHRAEIERKEQKDVDEWFLLRPEQKLLRDQASLRRELLQQRREF